MTWQTSRRHFLRACSAAAGAGLLQACGTGTTVTPSTQTGNTAKAQPVQPKTSHPPRSGDNLLRVDRLIAEKFFHGRINGAFR